MKLILRHMKEEWREPIEKETQRHVLKLQKLLKRYAPDLVRLPGGSPETSQKGSLSLSQ